jgi:hypothetical protein
MKFLNFFPIFVVYFALLDPDTDLGTPLNLDPDPQHWLRDRHCEESAEFFTPERLAKLQRKGQKCPNSWIAHAVFSEKKQNGDEASGQNLFYRAGGMYYS